MTRIVSIGLLTVFAGAAQDGPPGFDVASIRVSQFSKNAAEGSRRENIQFSPDSLTMRNVTLRASLRWAYNVMPYQVQGPGWINSDRFDIVAKAAGPVAEDRLRLMLQTLLAERFKMELHRETKELPAYLLQIAKGGPKFQESKTEGESAIQPQKEKMIVSIQRTPISQLTDMLSTVLQAPVLDKTALTGRYDISINVAKYLEDMKPTNGIPDVIGILMTGLQEELGLKLESKRTSLDLVIVDRAEKIPAEN